PFGRAKRVEGTGILKFDWHIVEPLKTDLLSEFRGGTVSPNRWKALALQVGCLQGVVYTFVPV
ncbi:MAG: hypothetical protein ACK544_04810, partial [Microcystis sp.]